jgi:hypothetical protein
MPAKVNQVLPAHGIALHTRKSAKLYNCEQLAGIQPISPGFDNTALRLLTHAALDITSRSAIYFIA